MNDDTATMLAILLVLGLTAFVFSVGFRQYNPSRDEFAVALASGNVVVGMNESMVAEVWGIPHHVQDSKRVLTGWLAPVESYSWVYYEPYRKVTFQTEGYGERVTKVEW